MDPVVMTHPMQQGVAVTNSAFLRELAAAAPRGSSLWVTAFVGNPDLGSNWGGRPYNPVTLAETVDGWGAQNTYFSVAALMPDSDGELHRRKANFARLLTLVTDDVDPADLSGNASWVLQTSPGKRQVGIFLDGADPDCSNQALVDRLVTTMATKGLIRADRAGNNTVRYVRLLQGQNQKPRDSGAWTHMVEQWGPSVRLSLEDAAAVFGVDLADVRAAPLTATAPSTTGEQGEHLRELTASVIRGEALHDSLNMIAASLVATGVPGGAVVNLLRGLMDASSAPRDERFHARFADIPRAVTTAQEKFARPTTAEALSAEGGLVLTVPELHRKAGSVKWAVKHVVPEHGLGFIYGASGTFKSFVALDYALHRAYGMKWMGRRTRKATPVYLAAEGGAGLMRRIEAWHLMRKLDWRKCPMRVVIVPLTLRTEAATLREAIVAAGVTPGDLIVDTMSQTFTGNENSNDEVAEFLRVLGSDLRDGLDCTVTVVHHSGHSATERPRGASAIVSNVDFAFGVFRDEKEMLATMEFAKVKDSERPAAQTFSLSVQELGRDEDGDPITSLVASHINNAEELLAAVEREGKAGRGGNNNLLMSLVENGAAERDVRKAFYEQLGSTKEPEAKKKAFYRARDWAIQSGLIEVVQGVVLVSKGAV
jgi:AAA domain-containing protein